MDSSYFTYAIIVVGIFTAYMALVNIFRRDRMRDRVQASVADSYYEDDDGAPPLFASFCQGMLALLGTDIKKYKDVSSLLLQAGITSPYAIYYYLFFQRIVQPIIFMLGAFIFLKVIVAGGNAGAMAKIFQIGVATLLMGAGLFGAKTYVTNMKQRRQKILLLSFPEALDLMLVCIESGLGLDAALARVCAELRHTHPVVASELDRTRIQLTVMSDRGQALANLAERTEIVPFKSLVSALIQTEKFGTSLLDTLRVLSDDIRTTRLMNAENRAARIPVLITVPLILCMLPAFIMIILGPPIVRVVEQGGIFGEKHTSKD